MAIQVERLKGVVPPVVTPLTSSEELDEDGLRRLLEHLLEGGVHGLYMLGTTGEFPSLTNSVKVRAIELTSEEVGGEVPILAGAGETSTRRAVELAKQLEQAGADVIFSTPPFYFDYTQEELKDYYLMLADQLNTPVFLYNIPQLTRVALDPRTVRELAEDPRIVGIKDSSGDFGNYLEHIRTAGNADGFRSFIGSEVLAGASLIMGGHGVVASTANVVPGLWARLYERAAAGDVEGTRELEEKTRIVTGITEFGIAPSCKAGLEIMGITSRHVAAPHRALTDSEVGQVRAVLEEADVL
jgi:4-hydroxy-tetrahydrodipicolinate synthase